MADLPQVPSLKTIEERLQLIFPDGTPHRKYLVRDIACRTIFVMFYVGAVESRDCWIRPDQATKMTHSQAQRTSNNDRLNWAAESLRPGTFKDIPGR